MCVAHNFIFYYTFMLTKFKNLYMYMHPFNSEPPEHGLGYKNGQNYKLF